MGDQPSTSRNNVQGLLLIDLPNEVLELILESIAESDYYALLALAKTCHKLRDLCSSFMKRNPAAKYQKKSCRPAGLSDNEDEDEWNYDKYDGDYCDEDALDEFYDKLDCLSFGSNFDEDIDDFVNELRDDEARDAQVQPTVGGDQDSAGDSAW